MYVFMNDPCKSRQKNDHIKVKNFTLNNFRKRSILKKIQEIMFARLYFQKRFESKIKISISNFSLGLAITHQIITADVLLMH